MDRYTIAQRIEIVKIHYTNGENVAETLRKIRTAFGHSQPHSRTVISKLIKKFERFGEVGDVKKPTRARPARSDENIAAVAESVAENRDLSISRRSEELGISQASLHRILHKDLGIHYGLEPDEDITVKEELVEETVTEEPEETKSESPPPVKKGRGRKAEVEKEERKPTKTAGAKKVISGVGRRRKRQEEIEDNNETVETESAT